MSRVVLVGKTLIIIIRRTRKITNKTLSCGHVGGHSELFPVHVTPVPSLSSICAICVIRVLRYPLSGRCIALLGTVLVFY